MVGRRHHCGDHLAQSSRHEGIGESFRGSYVFLYGCHLCDDWYGGYPHDFWCSTRGRKCQLANFAGGIVHRFRFGILDHAIVFVWYDGPDRYRSCGQWRACIQTAEVKKCRDSACLAWQYFDDHVRGYHLAGNFHGSQGHRERYGSHRASGWSNTKNRNRSSGKRSIRSPDDSSVSHFFSDRSDFGVSSEHGVQRFPSDGVHLG
ncbi:unannotated protein [freshwater metagenome]|uniref:Unannotated protein n=1 Tax=freshwater metagenome TaxID=449393 RepID=A0A6J7GXC6_9ZZZZ